MKIFWVLPAAAVAAATLADPSNILPEFAPSAVASLSKREVHENALKYHPSNWIVNSTELEAYLVANRGSNHTVYIEDEQAFVSLATVEYDSKALAGRESGGCVSPAKYTKTYTKQTGQWPGSWGTASACLWTGKSNLGGSQSISTSYSISIEQNAGLSLNVIADVLSASLGLSVTQTWSQSRSYVCGVKANSVVQVWTQPYIAWGWFWSQSCYSNSNCGGCAAEYVNGGATAPAKNPNTGQWLNYGCSTGRNNVKC